MESFSNYRVVPNLSSEKDGKKLMIIFLPFYKDIKFNGSPKYPLDFRRWYSLTCLSENMI